MEKEKEQSVAAGLEELAKITDEAVEKATKEMQKGQRNEWTTEFWLQVARQVLIALPLVVVAPIAAIQPFWSLTIHERTVCGLASFIGWYYNKKSDGYKYEEVAQANSEIASYIIFMTLPRLFYGVEPLFSLSTLSLLAVSGSVWYLFHSGADPKTMKNALRGSRRKFLQETHREARSKEDQEELDDLLDYLNYKKDE